MNLIDVWVLQAVVLYVLRMDIAVQLARGASVSWLVSRLAELWLAAAAKHMRLLAGCHEQAVKVQMLQVDVPDAE